MSKLRNIQDSIEHTLKELMYAPTRGLRRNVSAVVDRLTPFSALQLQIDLKSNYYTLAKSVFFIALKASLIHEITKHNQLKDGIFLRKLKKYLKIRRHFKKRASGLPPKLIKNSFKIPF